MRAAGGYPPGSRMASRSHEPETLHPRHGHRVTLTAAPESVSSETAPIEKSLMRNRARPRNSTANVQLYLPEAGQSRPWMGAPLGGFGWRVKD